MDAPASGLRLAATAAGSAVLFPIGPVAVFFGPVDADGLGMGRLPDVRPERVVVGRASQQPVEHVLDVGPDVQIVPHGAGHEREEVGRPLTRRDAPGEEPVLPVMLSSA